MEKKVVLLKKRSSDNQEKAKASLMYTESVRY